MTDTVEALGMFKKIEEDVKDGKVGQELWCIVNLIFHTGLEKREICNLKIKEVVSGNGITNQIALDPSKPFQLPSEVKEILSGYVQNLRSSKGSSITGESPLFPSYAEVNERKLTRHLDEYGSFNYLRSGGVKYFYETVKRRGSDVQEIKDKAVEDTALHFHIDEKTVKEDLFWFVSRDSQIQNKARALKEYEILLDDKVEKLIRDYKKECKKSVMNAKSLPDQGDLKKEEVTWNSVFLEHILNDSVFRHIPRPQSIKDLLDKPLGDRSDPKWVKSLEEEILNSIKNEKSTLTLERKAELEKEKQKQGGLEPKEEEIEDSNDTET